MVIFRFFFALVHFVMLSHHAFALDTHKSIVGYILTTYPISYSVPFGPYKEIINDKKDTDSPSDKHDNVRKLLLLACENYLLILPKQMGCGLCQIAHTLVGSKRYQHVQERRKEVEILIELLNKNPFSPQEAIKYIKYNMEPFAAGHYGANFHAQCTIMLQSIHPFGLESEEFSLCDIP